MSLSLEQMALDARRLHHSQDPQHTLLERNALRVERLVLWLE
jgi:hypothetical protein